MSNCTATVPLTHKPNSQSLHPTCLHYLSCTHRPMSPLPSVTPGPGTRQLGTTPHTHPTMVRGCQNHLQFLILNFLCIPILPHPFLPPKTPVKAAGHAPRSPLLPRALCGRPCCLFPGICDCKLLSPRQSFPCLHVLLCLIKTNPGYRF